MSRKETVRLIRNILAYIFVAAIFYFLGKQLIHNWRQIEWGKYNFDPLYLLLSYLLFSLSFLLGVKGWHLILKSLGETIAFTKTFKILATAQLGKYIPGRIWFALSRLYQTERQQVRQSSVINSLVLEIQFVVLSALFYYLILLVTPSAQKITGFKLPLWMALLLTLILFYPDWSRIILQLAYRIRRKEVVLIKLKYLDFLRILGVYLLSWGLQGLAFLALVSSVSGWKIEIALYLMGAYITAWLIGVLVLFAPAGLGVREGALSFLLKFCLPLPFAIALSLLSRIWVTLGELSMALFALKIK